MCSKYLRIFSKNRLSTELQHSAYHLNMPVLSVAENINENYTC